MGTQAPRVQSDNTLTEKVRALLKSQLNSGWTVSRVAAEMQALGHKGWSDNIVYTFSKGHRRTLTLDEGLALMAVFGGYARLTANELERLTKQVVASAERRGSPKREGSLS